MGLSKYGLGFLLRVLYGSIIGFLKGIYKGSIMGIMGLSKYGSKYPNGGSQPL